MSKLTWAVQASIDVTKHDLMFDICEELKQPFLSVPIVPFSTELPDIDFPNPTLPYGSTAYIGLAKKDSRLSEYVYYDPELFKASVYYERLGYLYFNRPLYLGPIKDMPEVEVAFVKSDADSKQLAGSVYFLEDIQELKRVTQSQLTDKGIISPDLEIFVAEANHEILKANEYRTIFLNGCYLTGSSYRIEGKPCCQRLLDSKIIKFAESVIDLFNPSEVTVVDIVETSSGLKVMEYNTFNCSGWYESDYELIITEVSKYIESK